MTEGLGPLAIESLDQPGGLYVLETACIAEIIDPQTELPVACGDEEGELVITNLWRTGQPVNSVSDWGSGPAPGVAQGLNSAADTCNVTGDVPLYEGGGHPPP